MKVNVYAKLFEPEYIDNLVWSGNLESIPRVGEQIFIFDGWGGVTVKGVYWELRENSVEIWFEDRNGEYSKKAKELGVEL